MAVANVNPEYDDRTISAGFRAERDSQTQTGNMQAANDNNPGGINQVERQYTAANDNYAPSSVPVVRKKMKVKHKVSGSTKTVARLKLTAINGWVTAWAVFWYLSVQLPFALISTVSLGMAAAVYSSLSSVTEVEGRGGVINYVLNAVEVVAASALLAVSKILFGLNFDPTLIFIAPFALIFLFVLSQLLLTWFVYSLAGIKSLSGEKGGLKSITFMMAGVGCVIPVLNLFPLIFLWMIMVWKYPK